MNFFKIAIYKGDNHYKIENQDFRKTSYSSFEIPNDITFEDNKTSPRLTFIKCKFDDFTIHSNSYYTNDSFSLRFEECLFDNFNNEQQSTYGPVTNKEFSGEYLYINIINCFIKSELKIKNVNTLSFYNSFIKTVSLINIENLKITIGNNLPIKDRPEYIVELGKYEDLSGFNRFHIINCLNITISSTKKCKSYLKEIKDLNSFIITMLKLVEGSEISIKNFVFKSLEIRGTFNHDIEIQNSSIQNLLLDTYSNSKKSLFYNVNNIEKTESLISITNSDLNQVTFDNLFFNEYAIIHLFRNTFENSKLIGCDFPESIKEFNKIHTVENIKELKNKAPNYYKVRYETFLQLKNVLEKSGNYYEAQKFKAASDEALKKIPRLPYTDKIILELNGLSNQHGQSFLQTFVMFICSTILLYCLYLCALGFKFQLFGAFDSDLVNYYFTFIDITHKRDFISNSKNNIIIKLGFWALFIDYLSKVIIGYLIYQFIAAFRKYGKK